MDYRDKHLETQLIAILTRAGQEVEALEIIGYLDRSERSLVFSLLINHRYYVAKLYHIHANFVRDLRNRRRLAWLPPVFLASRYNQNKLGRDLIITAVPEGVSFNSQLMLDWVQQRLGEHLIELHRIRRSRPVAVARLHQSVADTEAGALEAAGRVGPRERERAAQTIVALHEFLNRHGSIMRVQPSLLHNDVWWDNIIVAKDDVYLIDWEWMRTGDYLEDIAYARVMLIFRPVHNHSRKFWHGPRDEIAADRFFAGIVDLHRHEFNDPTAYRRLNFYLALHTLRRLSDYSAGTYGVLAELPAYWAAYLPHVWENGLGPAL